MTPSFILTYQYFVKNRDSVTTGKLKKQRLPSQTRHKVAIQRLKTGKTEYYKCITPLKKQQPKHVLN